MNEPNLNLHILGELMMMFNMHQMGQHHLLQGRFYRLHIMPSTVQVYTQKHVRHGGENLKQTKLGQVSRYSLQ